MAGRQRANGEGSIRERYPGCWEGRYTAGYDILTGKRIQKGVFAKTRKECAAKLARAIQQDTGPYYRKGKGYDSQPLSTWIRLWFDSYTKPNLRPSSADGYRSMIENHIIPVLGHIQLSKLSSIQIQRFYNDLHTQGRLDNHGNRKYEPLSASTVKHIHAVLSGALKQAVTPAARPPTMSGTGSSLARRSSRVFRLLCPPTSTAASIQPISAVHIISFGTGWASILGAKRRIPRIRRTVRFAGTFRPAAGTTTMLRAPPRTSVSAPSLKS